MSASRQKSPTSNPDTPPPPIQSPSGVDGATCTTSASTTHASSSKSRARSSSRGSKGRRLSSSQRSNKPDPTPPPRGASLIQNPSIANGKPTLTTQFHNPSEGLLTMEAALDSRMASIGSSGRKGKKAKGVSALIAMFETNDSVTAASKSGSSSRRPKPPSPPSSVERETTASPPNSFGRNTSPNPLVQVPPDGAEGAVADPPQQQSVPKPDLPEPPSSTLSPHSDGVSDENTSPNPLVQVPPDGAEGATADPPQQQSVPKPDLPLPPSSDGTGLRPMSPSMDSYNSWSSAPPSDADLFGMSPRQGTLYGSDNYVGIDSLGSMYKPGSTYTPSPQGPSLLLQTVQDEAEKSKKADIGYDSAKDRALDRKGMRVRISSKDADDPRPRSKSKGKGGFKAPGLMGAPSGGFKTPGLPGGKKGGAGRQSRTAVKARPGTGSLTLDLKSKDSILFQAPEAGSSRSLKRFVTIDSFELLKVIGRGSFGKVFMVKKRDDRKVYAMKTLRKAMLMERNMVGSSKEERKILQQLQHPFIVGLKYAFQNKDKLYMVLDYVNGGELFAHLKDQTRFPESRTRLYTAEIILALEHCHSQNIVYRDLKPENVLVDSDGHLKLTDFGLSKTLDFDEKTKSFCGTPDYLAPEILRREEYGHSVDWWSLGALVFEMLTGQPPFYNQNLSVMYHKILNAEVKYPAHISKDAKDLISKFLERDATKRLGSGETDSEEIKAHPWFKDLNWDDVFEKKVKPEWMPPVKSHDDTSQFDEEFTSEEPIDSVVEVGSLNHGVPQFPGFTFDGGSGHLK